MSEFAVNKDKMSARSFRFCGKEIEQDRDYNVTVTCRDTTEQIGPIRYTIGSRKLNDQATEKRNRTHEISCWTIGMGSKTVPTRYIV